MQEIQISMQEDRGRLGKTKTGLKMLNIYYLALYGEWSLGRVQFSEGWVVYTNPLSP